MSERIEKLLNGHSIPKEEIPKIDLYMDQLLGLFEENFDHFRRTDEDKILTKTMINNYVKAKVVSRPEKKKYGKEHMIQLAMLYQLKGVLSIHDLHNLLSGIRAEHDSMSDFYDTFLSMENQTIGELRTYCNQLDTVTSSDEKLERIMQLLIESSLKKRLAEMLLDDYSQEVERL